MNYEEERERYVSFCGSYCRTCDWFSGKIRRTFQSALYMLEEYGFKKLLEGKVDIESFKEGLRILANTSIDSGCKAEIAKNPEEDRCEIRQCCSGKGLDLCCECPQFPCDLLESNSGVVKFHCIENLKEIKEKGIEHWIDRKLSIRRESS
jgi:hypothetical protein